MIKDNIMEAAKTAGISVKKTRDLLYLVSKNKQADTKSLIQLTGLSKSSVGLVLKDIPKFEDAEFSANYRMEEEEWNLYNKGEATDLIEWYKQAIANRPRAARKFDQFFALEDTVARRINLMDFYGDIDSKRLLFLGDDDGGSIAAAGLRKAKEISVLDIDKQILNNIKNISVKENLGITTGQYDARKMLPGQYKGKYDVVFTDPPYTAAGVGCFLSRAIEALDRSNPAARVYLCFGNSDRAKERFLPVYDLFVESGMMIRRVWDKFNRYEGAESIGSTSTLYMLEVTPRTKPVIKKEADGYIYTNN